LLISAAVESPRPKLKRQASDESMNRPKRSSSAASRLHHLTLTRAQGPEGRKLPTKSVSEFHALKPDFPTRSFEEADAGDIQAEEETKKFVPPRGMGMPMFDPSAVKAKLKKTTSSYAVKSEDEEKEEEKTEDVSPRKPPPFGAKGLPGMGMSMGDLGGVKLKKSAAPAQKAAEPAKAEQVDFRAMLKPSAKK